MRPRRKTWKERIGKRLTKHVEQTTERTTLAEFINNFRAGRAGNVYCYECEKIAIKLGIVN